MNPAGLKSEPLSFAAVAAARVAGSYFLRTRISEISPRSQSGLAQGEQEGPLNPARTRRQVRTRGLTDPLVVLRLSVLTLMLTAVAVVAVDLRPSDQPARTEKEREVVPPQTAVA